MTFKATTRLVEYHPYPHRSEQCTVGLLAFLPDGRVKAHAGVNLRKVRALDPACEVQALRDGMAAAAAEIERHPSCLPLHVSGFGTMRVSASEGYITYADDEQYQAAVNWSLQVAVEPQAAVATRERPAISRLFLEVKRVFNAHDWIASPAQSLADRRIVARFPIVAEEGLILDFALNSDAMLCMQTVDYRNNAATRRADAQAKLLTLGLSHQLVTGAQSYALIAGAAEPDAKAGLRLAERTADDIFIHESSDDMGRFMDILANAMGQSSMPQLATH